MIGPTAFFLPNPTMYSDNPVTIPAISEDEASRMRECAAAIEGVLGRMQPALHPDGEAPTPTSVTLSNGLPFDYLDSLTWKNLTVEVIARSLSRLPRFCGHRGPVVSVAKHSIWCAVAARASGMPVRLQLCLLLHDAEESVVNDRPFPHKAAFGHGPDAVFLGELWHDVYRRLVNDAGSGDVCFRSAVAFQDAKRAFDRLSCSMERLEADVEAAREVPIPGEGPWDCEARVIDADIMATLPPRVDLNLPGRPAVLNVRGPAAWKWDRRATELHFLDLYRQLKAELDTGRPASDAADVTRGFLAELTA
jgi:hypothetical protein